MSSGPGFAYHDLVRRLAPSMHWPFDAVYGVRDISGAGRNGAAAGGLAVGGYAGVVPPGLGGPPGAPRATDFAGGWATSTYDPFVNGTVRTFAGWARRDSTSGFHTLVGSNGSFASSSEFVLYGNSGGSDLYTTSALFTYPAGSSQIWAGAYGSGAILDGQQAQLAVWERALAAGEILALAKAGAAGGGASWR